MADIATLSIVVENAQVPKATASLDAMTVAYGIGPDKAGQGAPMPNG